MIAPAPTAETVMVVFREVTITQRATFTVASLAEMTGQTVDDVIANIEGRTLDAFAEDYLPTPAADLAMRTYGAKGEGPDSWSVYRTV